MVKKELNAYLGDRVKVLISFDKIHRHEYLGTLHRTGEKEFENIPQLTELKDWYFLTENDGSITCFFQMVHVRKIRELAF